jgi:murein L,D-transpeptidase YafK
MFIWENTFIKRRQWVTIWLVSLIGVSFIFQSNFLSEQKKYERVRLAYIEKEALIRANLKASSLGLENVNLLLVSYKAEAELELYAKAKDKKVYIKIATYSICSSSGKLGPKRRQGDNQVPEGFYYIDRYNPSSSYYLSLGLNYPNLSDKRKNKAADLGGDIFIHGECVTIGCMPMTNDKIKEIYLYAINARNSGQLKIPVYVFPFRFTEENLRLYKEKYLGNSELLNFWANLKTGYDLFQKEKKELRFSVNENGDYVF